jgi:NADH:ubiquinone oxidoreductase subunit E
MDTAKLDEIIKANGSTRIGVIPILQEIQANFNYLPEDMLRYVSKKLDMPLIDEDYHGNTRVQKVNTILAKYDSTNGA